MTNRKLLSTLFLCSILTILSIGCGGDKDTKSADSNDQQTSIKGNSAVCIWDGIAMRENPSEKGKWISSISLGEKLTNIDR